MYMYEQPTFYDEREIPTVGWYPYESAPPFFPQQMPQQSLAPAYPQQIPQPSIPHNQLRKKVDSVASLNDIAERDYVEMLPPPPPPPHRQMQMQSAHPRAGSAMPYYHYDQQFNQPTYPQYPPHQMENEPMYTQYPPDFETPMGTPLRQLSLNHPIHSLDPYDRRGLMQPDMEQKVQHDPYDKPLQRRVSFVDSGQRVMRSAAPPPPHPYADSYQDDQMAFSVNANPRVLSVHEANSNRGAMPPPHGSSGVLGDNTTQEQEFITISFKPQVRLVHGETVKLVLTDFEGPDVQNFPVQCRPERAFTTASWISESKQLDMVLGANVDMNVPVTIIIPYTAGIRRITTEPQSSSVPPIDQPAAPTLLIPPLKAVPSSDVAEEVAMSPPDEVKKQMRAEERRKAFLAAANDVASPASPEQPSVTEDDGAEVFFDEIPDLPPNQLIQEQLSPLAQDEGLTQAQWARKRLEQEPRAVLRSVQLDSTSVAVQSVWAKQELSNRSAPEAPKKFDASAVAEQSQWAKEQLENRPRRESENKFDAEAVASQAKWAKESLSNRETHQAESKFDAAAVAQQAKWARERLELMPQNEEEEEKEEEEFKKQELFNAFPDIEDVIEEEQAGGK